MGIQAELPQQIRCRCFTNNLKNADLSFIPFLSLDQKEYIALKTPLQV